MKTNTSRTFVMGLILTLLIASNHSQAAAPDLSLEQILDRIEKRYAGKGRFYSGNHRKGDGHQ